MRFTRAVVALALTATLATGCDGDSKETPAAPDGSTSGSPSPAETSEPPEGAGPLVDRGTYTFNLPEGWQDTTDQAAYVSDDSSVHASDTSNSSFTMTVSYFEDAPFSDLKDAEQIALEVAEGTVRNPQRRADVDWAGEPALRIAGPLIHGRGRYEQLTVLHGGDSFTFSLHSPDGKAPLRKALDVIRSTWQWK